jgi:hypothetical protein
MQKHDTKRLLMVCKMKVWYSVISISLFLCIGVGILIGYRLAAPSTVLMSLGNLQLVYSDVSKRMILIKESGAGDAAKVVKVCAEPPPDAGINASDSLKALISTSLKGAGTEGSAQANTERQTQANLQSLLTRSQGLQNLRDILYRACEANLNGVIDQQQFSQIFKVALASTTALIATEMISQKADIDSNKAKELLNFIQIMFAHP